MVPESMRFADARRRAGFEQRLLKVLRRKSDNITDHVFLMSFERLKETGGRPIHDLSERVAGTLAAACDRKLSGDARYEQYDDLHHVLIVQDGSAHAAHAAAAEIAEIVAREATSGAAGRQQVTIRGIAPGEDGELTFREIAAGRGADVARQPAGESAAPELDFVFRPLLNVKTGLISTYLCLPIKAAGDGTTVSGYRTLPDDPDLRALARLDATSLERAVEIFAGEAVRTARSLVIVPVHFRVISDKVRGEEFFRRCKLLTMEVRKRLIFEVVGIPAKITPDLLEFSVSAIKPYCRQVIARVPMRQSRFAGYRAAGIYAVGLDFYDFGRQGDVSMASLDAFAEAAEKAGLRLFAHGIRSISLSTAVVCAGFDYVGGHAVSDVALAPREPSPFDPKAPYRRLLRAA